MITKEDYERRGDCVLSHPSCSIKPSHVLLGLAWGCVGSGHSNMKRFTKGVLIGVGIWLVIFGLWIAALVAEGKVKL